jgi:Tfp pilus assembly protein PilW
MPNKILALALGSVVTLAACTDTAYEPIVTSFNESSVGIQIQQSTFAVMNEGAQAQAIAMADAKAQNICSRGPNRTAERTSSRQVPAGEYVIATEYLYLCLK